MLRSVLEYLSKGIVLKRKLPADFGSRTLFVSPEGGGLRYWKPALNNIDPMLFQVVKSCIKPGYTIWDVGGNVGLFAFASAVKSNGGQVAIFEPDISLCNLLRKSADLNPDLNIDIFPLAVSNKDGVSVFHIANRSRSSNHLAEVSGLSQTGGIQKSLRIPTVALDSFLAHYARPDFIKIDVEGAEHLVFEGMEKILSTVRPSILCEVSGENSPLIAAILKRNRYKIFNADKLPDFVESDTPAYNALAIPE